MRGNVDWRLGERDLIGATTREASPASGVRTKVVSPRAWETSSG